MKVNVGDIIRIKKAWSSFDDYTNGSTARVISVEDHYSVEVEWLTHPEGFTPADLHEPCTYVAFNEYEIISSSKDVSPTFSL